MQVAGFTISYSACFCCMPDQEDVDTGTRPSCSTLKLMQPRLYIDFHGFNSTFYRLMWSTGVHHLDSFQQIRKGRQILVKLVATVEHTLIII